MKFNFLIGLCTLALVASANSFASAQIAYGTDGFDQRLSAPTLGGIAVGTPGDTVVQPLDNSKCASAFRSSVPVYSCDLPINSATAIEYGLIANMLPWMSNNGNNSERSSATAIEDGLITAMLPWLPNNGNALIAVVIITASDSEPSSHDDAAHGKTGNTILFVTSNNGELGYIKIGDIKGELKSSVSDDRNL